MVVALTLSALYGLCHGLVWLVRRARAQRRPTSVRASVTPAMQQKMARALTTLITSGGMRELPQAKRMSKGFNLRRQHFETLAVPPEEDFARDNLMKAFR